MNLALQDADLPAVYALKMSIAGAAIQGIVTTKAGVKTGNALWKKDLPAVLTAKRIAARVCLQKLSLMASQCL